MDSGSLIFLQEKNSINGDNFYIGSFRELFMNERLLDGVFVGQTNGGEYRVIKRTKETHFGSLGRSSQVVTGSFDYVTECGQHLNTVRNGEETKFCLVFTDEIISKV